MFMATVLFKALVFCSALILVSSRAPAATPPLAPDLSESPAATVPATDEEIERARAVHITEPPNAVFETATPAYLYRYRNSLSFRTGAAVPLSDLGNPGPINGFSYWFPIENQKLELKGIEVGTDLEKNSTGAIHASLRHMLSQDSVRYFYKYGLGLNIVASDQLVTVLRLKNWQARGGFGVEVTLSDPMSLRWDFEGHVTSEKNRLLTTLGLSFAW